MIAYMQSQSTAG